jgi:prepilin-type N-terminal cleavage/methylation domain-containing protein
VLVARIVRVMSKVNRVREPAGFTLVEVLIAIGIFVAIAIGVAQLIATATRAMRASREHTSAVILAAAKMDQLRSLAWEYEPEVAGVPAMPRSDLTTNVSDPAYGDDGRGLRASPPGALVSNMPPYVDYLDEAGDWVGNDREPPEAAVFIRRWAVVPLPEDPARTVVLQVLVTTVRLDRSRGVAWRGRSGAEALLVSVRTRMRR